jgi:hypothetical protein
MAAGQQPAPCTAPGFEHPAGIDANLTIYVGGIDAIAHQAASAKLPEVIDFYLRAVSRSRKTSSARLSALSPK